MINRRLHKIQDTPPQDYALIKALYDDIRDELKLTEAYDPISMLGANNAVTYVLKRGLIESYEGGSYYFASEGRLENLNAGQPQGSPMTLHDSRNFQGWRYEPI